MVWHVAGVTATTIFLSLCYVFQWWNQQWQSHFGFYMVVLPSHHPYRFPISLNSLFACAELLLFNIRKPDVSELLSLVSIKTYLHLFIYKQATAGQPSDVWSNLRQVLFPHELRALFLYLIAYHCAWWQHNLLFTAHYFCLWDSVWQKPCCLHSAYKDAYKNRLGSISFFFFLLLLSSVPSS